MDNTKEEYLKAWSEDDTEKKEADPVVAAVKAARQADQAEFEDAFKNDNFGIDPAPHSEGEAKEDDKNKVEIKE